MFGCEHQANRNTCPICNERERLLGAQKEELRPFTKERYDEIVSWADKHGIKIKTKWRKGLKTIKTTPIVLSD